MPLPPRPKETQRHLALTQLLKSRENLFPHPRQRPKVSQRPSRGPHLAQGQEKIVKEEPLDSLRHGLCSESAAAATNTIVTLPLGLCNSLPLRLWPHPLLQHEVTASQSGRARENTSDTDWLHGPPLPLPTPLTERSGSLWSKKTETAISGKDPENRNRNHRVILLGKPFILWPSLLFFDNRLSDPPPFSQLPSKRIPDPLPAHYPAAGKSFPGPKKQEVATATAPTATTAFYPDTRWQGGGADGGCVFPVASPPDLFRFSLLHRDGAGLNSSAFIRCSEPAH